MGIQHIGFRVKLIEDAKNELVELGFANEHEIQIHYGSTGIKYFFIKDPDGNFLEIVQDDRIL